MTQVKKYKCECGNPEPKTRDDKYNTIYCANCLDILDYEKPNAKKELDITSKKKADKKPKNTMKAKQPSKKAEPKKEPEKKLVGHDLFGEPIYDIADGARKEGKDALRENYIEPPFTVLDTKRGEWQARKREWKALGIQSEVSREDVKVINNSFDGEKYGRDAMPEVSIFDPALCEVLYNWFCEKGGTILDPFAGGSVRGIVANYLGYNYTGIDIRSEQVVSNNEQGVKILGQDRCPEWIIGDSNQVLSDDPLLKDAKFDFVFSCPPYADLEVYSNLKGDISNKPYKDFVKLYTSIIVKACSKLKRNRYACFVIGDVRDKDGFYYDFVGDTKKAFYEAGLKLYNDVVLLQPLGTAMLRAAKVFESGRKLTKVHENVLVFKKV